MKWDFGFHSSVHHDQQILMRLYVQGPVVRICWCCFLAPLVCFFFNALIRSIDTKQVYLHDQMVSDNAIRVQLHPYALCTTKLAFSRCFDRYKKRRWGRRREQLGGKKRRKKKSISGVPGLRHYSDISRTEGKWKLLNTKNSHQKMKEKRNEQGRNANKKNVAKLERGYPKVIWRPTTRSSSTDDQAQLKVKKPADTQCAKIYRVLVDPFIPFERDSCLCKEQLETCYLRTQRGIYPIQKGVCKGMRWRSLQL